MSKSKYLTELENLKEKIPQVLAECLDEYALDLCDEGLADFCTRLGVEWNEAPRFSVLSDLRIGVFGIDMPSFDRTNPLLAEDDNLEEDLENLVGDFLSERYPGLCWEYGEVSLIRQY